MSASRCPTSSSSGTASISTSGTGISPTSTSSETRRLLLLHGAGSSGARHAGFAAAARARGYDVQAPDFPRPYSAALLEWAVSLVRPGDVLYGSSLGAWLALHAAAAAEPAAVVALAPTDESKIAERRLGWEVASDDSLERLGTDIYEAVKTIRAPVLYVVARDDERIPLTGVERLHRLTPRSELAVLDHGGHSAPAHDPAAHDLVLAWLERTLGEHRLPPSP